MLNIERLLQVNIALLVVLGAVLLGLGHGNASLPIMATVAAVVSLYLTDIRGVFYFNRIVANIAAILAAAYSLNDFFRSDSESQLLSIASLLIYLQMVLLFQRKSSRLYWQLLVLSLLQVVVAAALYVRVESGFLFFVYMILALTAMTLTYVNRENQSIRQLADRSRDELNARETATPETAQGVLLRGSPVVVFNQTHENPMTIRRILVHALTAGAGAMVFAAVYFYSIPRMHETWRGPNFAAQSQTGFTKLIRFNNTGQITPSERVLFRASFIDPATDEPFKLDSDPYFRGIVLNCYYKNRGVDEWDYRQIETERSLWGPIPANDRAESMPRLKIGMDPNNERILFSSHPSYRVSTTPEELFFEYRANTIYRDSQGGSIAFSDYAYEVAVDNIRENRQADTYPYVDPVSRTSEEPMDRATRAYLLSRPRQGQPRLKEIAEELTKDFDPTDHRAIAERLSNHLRFSNEYRYTLDFRDVQMNRDIDSTEDFIANHKSGHCEYFASALCMMLRHLKIPARIVVGFRCDDFNTIGEHYVVQEKHAHAWVEAYLDQDNVSQEMIDNRVAGKGGAWFRLDPTPATAVPPNEDLLTRATDAFDIAQMLWDDFVFGFNANRQRSTYYDGLLANNPLIESIARSDNWDEAMENISASMGMEKEKGRKVIQIAIVVVILTGGLIYWYLAMRRKAKREKRKPPGLRDIMGTVATLISPRLGTWITGPEDSPLAGEKVDFYEQMVAVLRRNGFVRKDSQSQSEYIDSVLSDLENDPRHEALSPILPKIIDAFYLVRFGKKTVPPDRMNEIESWIGSLDRELQTTNLAAGNSPS